MALIEVNFVSSSLFRTVPIQVILPVDKLVKAGAEARERKTFRTLYLLHGILGNHTDWVSGTRIQRWAEEKNLAVVMPAGENRFYIDQPEAGNRYGEYIGKELVEITRRMFPLSGRREDTFIGGLSMGGFGAIRNGLKYYDTFSHIICLSGALHILEGAEGTGARKHIAFEESCFGDLEEAVKSDKNPRYLVERLKKEKKVNPAIEFPKLYMACGTEDGLIGANRVYRDFLKECGLDVTYEEGPGGHDWDFWDAYIKKAIQWLPLEEGTLGISSGHLPN